MTGEEAYGDMAWWMIYNATIGMMAWPQMLLIEGESTSFFLHLAGCPSGWLVALALACHG